MASNFPFPPGAQPSTYLNHFDDLQPYETRDRISLSFMDYDVENDRTILGPYLESTPTSLAFTTCFPRHYRKVLPINKNLIHTRTWLTPNHRYNSYHTFDK